MRFADDNADKDDGADVDDSPADDGTDGTVDEDDVEEGWCIDAATDALADDDADKDDGADVDDSPADDGSDGTIDEDNVEDNEEAGWCIDALADDDADKDDGADGTVGKDDVEGEGAGCEVDAAAAVGGIALGTGIDGVGSRTAVWQIADEAGATGPEEMSSASTSMGSGPTWMRG